VPALVTQRSIFKNKAIRVEHQTVAGPSLVDLATRVGRILSPQRNPSVVFVLANSRFVNPDGLILENLPKCRCGLVQRQLMQGNPGGRRKINLAGGVAGEGLSRLNPLVVLNLKAINGNNLISF